MLDPYIKSDRKKIYELLKQNKTNNPSYGYCVAIHQLYYNKDICEYDFSKQLYPELFKLKPKKGYLFKSSISVSWNHRHFWWKPGNVEIRIRAIDKVLNEWQD